MPFGITNGPSLCQRFMDTVLGKHEAYCVWYIDDILIFTCGRQEEHVQKVTLVGESLFKEVETNPSKTADQLGRSPSWADKSRTRSRQ